ncbi:MAG: hypothetical protein KGH79_02020, partial [Patescibacteria group bacterium]|nr:hypothetical protein [Patescibacteria group bacterium]
DLPSKKLSLQKIFGSNLSLYTREARGLAQPQWASLREAQNNFSETNLVSVTAVFSGFNFYRSIPARVFWRAGGHLVEASGSLGRFPETG